MPESSFATLYPRIGNAQRTAWVFIDAGIRNVPTTTGFSSLISRNLRGTGQRDFGAHYSFLRKEVQSAASPSVRSMGHLKGHLGRNATNYFMYRWVGPVCSLGGVIYSSGSSCI